MIFVYRFLIAFLDLMLFYMKNLEFAIKTKKLQKKFWDLFAFLEKQFGFLGFNIDFFLSESHNQDKERDV